MYKQNDTAIALHIPVKCDIGFEYIYMYSFKYGGTKHVFMAIYGVRVAYI